MISSIDSNKRAKFGIDTKPTQLAHLPSSCFEVAFSFLPLNSYMECRLVSKRWFNLTKDTKTGILNKFFQAKMLRAKFKADPHVKFLSIGRYLEAFSSPSLTAVCLANKQCIYFYSKRLSDAIAQATFIGLMQKTALFFSENGGFESLHLGTGCRIKLKTNFKVEDIWERLVGFFTNQNEFLAVSTDGFVVHCEIKEQEVIFRASSKLFEQNDLHVKHACKTKDFLFVVIGNKPGNNQINTLITHFLVYGCSGKLNLLSSFNLKTDTYAYQIAHAVAISANSSHLFACFLQEDTWMLAAYSYSQAGFQLAWDSPLDSLNDDIRPNGCLQASIKADNDELFIQYFRPRQGMSAIDVPVGQAIYNASTGARKDFQIQNCTNVAPDVVKVDKDFFLFSSDDRLTVYDRRIAFRFTVQAPGPILKVLFHAIDNFRLIISQDKTIKLVTYRHNEPESKLHFSDI